MAATSDPIADFLTRIRNAGMAQHRYVDVKFSVLKQSIAEILKSEGFIADFIVKQDEQGGAIRVFLKYTKDRTPIIQGLKRISRPGLRKYVKYREIPTVFGGMGISILSTPQGVLMGLDARSKKVGGELLCYVW
jgi:small subunit ribosomal protein S8